MVRKYGHKKVVPSTLRDVTIEYQDVSASFTTEPRCYGGVSIDSKEEELLGLSRKFAVFGKVDLNDCMGETDKCFAKISVIVLCLSPTPYAFSNFPRNNSTYETPSLTFHSSA